MIYTLKNDKLTVSISDLGAEVVSVRSADGCEYMWQGDEKYWKGQAPLLFPICGRLFGGKYTCGGKDYEMRTHGFARNSTFSAEQTDDSHARFLLRQSDATKELYPFDFELTVEYALCDDRLSSNIKIKNTGKTVMPAGIGLHPGFNVPLDSGSFEDWYIEFAEDCSPDEIVMTDTCFLTGKHRAFEIEDGRIIRLRHSLFDIDAIFMSRTAKELTLRSDKSSHFVNFRFDDFQYLGIWHKPRSDAPYVCIEPWCSLPSYDGEIDELEIKRDMFRLLPDAEKSLSYSLIFG